MAEYIEREAAIDACFDGWNNNAHDCAYNIRSIPAADVRPARRGKWIDMGDFILCSSCNATRLKEFESDYGKVMRLDVRTNFCPNCGADMRAKPPKEETE